MFTLYVSVLFCNQFNYRMFIMWLCVKTYCSTLKKRRHRKKIWFSLIKSVGTFIGVRGMTFYLVYKSPDLDLWVLWWFSIHVGAMNVLSQPMSSYSDISIFYVCKKSNSFNYFKIYILDLRQDVVKM